MKKYNIILSQNLELQVAVAYYKPEKDKSIQDVNQSATTEDLKNEKYQFTSDEIENLKESGSITFKKVVELGKVEVKDDEDYFIYQ